MFSSLWNWLYQIGLIGAFGVVGAQVSILTISKPAYAQITPDATLGVENSVVTPNVVIRGLSSDRISGGAIRGANLFHSFQEFNVGEGRGVYFTNPQGIENILSRVTGANPSEIFGRLGVLGNANLFLMNPNGIVFGQNASLDVEGSFLATTASAIALGEQGYFSATQPQQSSLLSVSPGALFFNQAASEPGNIINRGNLATGKDFTLIANNLDLQSQLVAGGNLTLQATDTVKIRDSVASPFLARSGGNLAIVGNQGIDILALNHPTQTPFISVGNLSLASDGIISGDARFVSGGSFSIHSASGGLANFVSLYDPIISSNGDVDVAANYTGASLLVESKGNIRFWGGINITRPDTNALPTGEDTATLSNSTALIMRSGQNTLTYGGVNSGSVPTLVSGTVPEGITLGGDVTLRRSNGSGGLVRLTTASGDVSTREITTNGGSIFINSAGAITTNGETLNARNGANNGGEISLNATNGNINTGNLNSYSYSTSRSTGQGGAISLNAGNGSITTGNLNSSSDSRFGNAVNGGAIALTALGNIITGDLNSYSYSASDNAGQGGSISLKTANGSITIDGNLFSYSNSNSGSARNAGTIDLGAAYGINISGNLNSASNSNSSSAANGGAISISTANGNITTGDINSFSNSNSGSAANGGIISLSNSNGNITTGDVNSSSNSNSGNVGNGGNITLKATNGSITTAVLNARSLSNSSANAGNGGKISLESAEDITTGNLDSYSRSESDSAGQGGAIVLTAGSNISTEFLDSGSRGEGNGGAFAITAGGNFSTFGLSSGSNKGNGGTIAITAGGNIISTRYLASNSSKGNGGEITVTAGGDFSGFGLESISGGKGNGGRIAVTVDGNITLEVNRSAVSTSDAGNGGAIILTAGGNITANEFYSGSDAGNGGEIALTAGGNVTIRNLISESQESSGGAVTINSTNARIILKSGRYGQALIDTEGANGGNVTLSSPNGNFVFENPSDLLSRPSGIYSAALNGNGGNIQIMAPSVSLSDVELNTSTRGRGNAGSISILTNGLVSLDGSRLFTSLEPGGLGRGGNITIDAGAVSLTNASFIDTATFGQGKAGDVSLQVDDSISLANDSAIFSFTAGQGDAGHVKLEARGAVELTNRSNISTAVNSRSQGDGGDIEIRARSLSLTGGSQLVTSTSSSGKAGDITVNTIEGIFISGTDPNFIPPKNVLVGNPLPLAEVEPNDSIAQAQPLTQFFLNSPDDVNPNVERSTQNPYVLIAGTRLSDDDDFYSFEVTAPGTRGIFHFNTPDDSDFIEIYNGSGNRLVLSSRVGPNDSSGFDNSVIRYVFSEPGIYYVNPERSLQGTYTFQISLETPNAATSLVNGTLPSGLFARTEGVGTAGNVMINTPHLTVTNGGNISATATAAATSTARGGNIEINSSQVNLFGNNSGLFALTQGAAPAGSLTLNPHNHGQSLTVNLQDNAQISASTSGSGQGGSLSIKAPQAATISGNGQLSVETSGAGAGGNLILETQGLTIQEGTQISASTTSTNPNGKGGNITVKTTQSLDLSNGASLLAQSNGAAAAGNVNINTGNLTARNGSITTSSKESSGGGITITADKIRLYGDSDITTNVGSGTGGGGDINLTAASIIAFGDSDILSFASDGKGGNIFFNTPAFFGQNYQPAAAFTNPRTLDQNNRVDINASGAVSGVITLPDTSFIQNSLSELPDNVIDTSNLIANSCIARNTRQQQGTFIITGSGGLPSRPGDALMSQYTFGTVRTNNASPSANSIRRPWQKGDPIVEPQGVYSLPSGRLVLSREC